MKHNRVKFGLYFASAFLFADSALAFPSFLTAWQDKYEDSKSGDLGCQLCHANAGGGEPWNEYGASIRNVLGALGALGGAPSPQDLDDAFDSPESNNVDDDPSGSTVLDEINHDYQPGWTVGNLNTIFFKRPGDPSRLDPTINQPPPQFSLDSTQLDPAIPTQNTLPAITSGNISVALQTVADEFTAPVTPIRAPQLPGFLFVVQQDGEIWRVNLNDGSKVLFHDVDAAPGVPLLFGGERGLLGLAFDPNYANNGYFYTYQSESNNGAPSADFSTTNNPDHQTVISEWRTTDPSSIDNFSVPNTRRVLMRIDQPQGNHNGGTLNFGPDGFLYISLGDGGNANDQGDGHGANGNGRDNSNPLGSVLRINPRGSNADNAQYGIPNDNPFTNSTTELDEIYAYGFRNPYRFSFDSLCFENGQTCNTLMLGDVGQNEVEEIDQVISGGNYGWNWKEGSFFFYPPVSSIYGGSRYISNGSPPSAPDDLIDPIAEYNSGATDGRSVIGGYIYRGSAITDLAGVYVFADFFNQLYYLDQSDRIRRFNTPNVGNISGFGEDHDNELYVVTQSGNNGKLQKLIASEQSEGDDVCVPIKTSNGAVAVICL